MSSHRFCILSFCSAFLNCSYTHVINNYLHHQVGFNGLLHWLSVIHPHYVWVSLPMRICPDEVGETFWDVEKVAGICRHVVTHRRSQEREPFSGPTSPGHRSLRDQLPRQREERHASLLGGYRVRYLPLFAICHYHPSVNVCTNLVRIRRTYFGLISESMLFLWMLLSLWGLYCWIGTLLFPLSTSP